MTQRETWKKRDFSVMEINIKATELERNGAVLSDSWKSVVKESQKKKTSARKSLQPSKIGIGTFHIRKVPGLICANFWYLCVCLCGNKCLKVSKFDIFISK